MEGGPCSSVARLSCQCRTRGFVSPGYPGFTLSETVINLKLFLWLRVYRKRTFLHFPKKNRRTLFVPPVSSPTRLSSSKDPWLCAPRLPWVYLFENSSSLMFDLTIAQSSPAACDSGHQKANFHEKSRGRNIHSDISATRLSRGDPVGFPPRPRERLSIVVYLC